MTTKLPAAFSPEVLEEMLSAEARAELARPYSAIDPRSFELAEGVEPRWFVVEARNRDVEAELIKQRFGIYVPESDEVSVRRGRRVVRRLPLIRGYVFVFLWETDANLHRLWTTPGVLAVLGFLPDDEIDELRKTENGERLDPAERERLKRNVLNKVQPTSKPKRSRRLKAVFRRRTALDG